MSPDRWQKVDDVFAGTAGLSTADLRAYLDSECAGDPELRREVELLLSYDRPETGLFQQIVEGAAENYVASARESAQTASSRVGSRIGPYRLVSLIGTGGMGAVYLGVRDDDQYHKKVAIKVVLAGMNTEFILDRFRQERQILAQLDHPNIARFLEGSVTHDGLPYYAMEFIEGAEPIVDHCEQRQLPLEKRLALFLQVATAVDHAHRNLVVHRDLKPGNILVDSQGVPKLLDFGIAKVLKEDPNDGTKTQTAVRLMTPDYGSPEQVLGRTVTTTTDVYSLGAVLYEMLTGRQAHLFRNYSNTEIERIICREDPTPPSQLLKLAKDAPEKLRMAREVEGDIDAIIAMAMRKEPDLRYASVRAMMDDIARFQAGAPVMARRGTMRYRAGKFVRRHKLPLAAAALLMLTLIGGIAATAYQARRADRRFQQVRSLANTLLTDFDKRIAALPQSTELRQWLTATVVEYLDNLAAEAGSDSTLQAELARGYMRVGQLQGAPGGPNLGQSVPALESYRKALAIYERLNSAGAYKPDLCEALRMVGQVEAFTGGMPSARRRFEQAVQLGESLLQVTPAKANECASQGYAGLVTVALGAANPSGALPYLSKQLEHAKLWARHDNSAQAREHILLTEISLANVRLDIGDAESALQLAGQAMAEGPKVLGAGDWETSVHKFRLHHVMGDGLGYPRVLSLGRKQEAIEHYRQALRIGELHLQRDGNDASARRRVELSLRKLAFLIVDEKPDEALAFYSRARELIELNIRNSPGNAEYIQAQADLLLGLGYAYQAQRRYAQALDLISKAVDRQNDLKRLSPEWKRFQREFQESYQALGDIQLQIGREADAIVNYEKALEVTVGLLWERPTDALLLRDLADTHEALARYHAHIAARGGPDRARSYRRATEFERKSLETWRDWPMKFRTGLQYAKTRETQAAERLAAFESRLK